MLTLRASAVIAMHSAMNLIPVLSILLTLVLFAGSCTVGGDMEKRDRGGR